MSFTPNFFSSIGGRPGSYFGPYYWELEIPVGFVNYEDGLWIRNRENSINVSSRVSIRSVIGTGTHYNVVGKISGYKNPEKIIIISAHYDTVMSGGFCDNGAGTAGIIELAKVFTDAINRGFYKPKYTLLFVAFAGEELGLVGSINYVKQHKSEMANIADVIHLDCIGSDELYVTKTDPANGFDLDEVILDAAQRLGINATLEEPGGSDQESFRSPSWANDIYYWYWGLEAGIVDATPVNSSAMLIAYPLLYSDKWNMGTPGWIHTSYDNSTSTATLNWVETEDLENHIKVAALTVMRISPNACIIVRDDYSTIQGAINAADTGDTIYVRKGTYYEHVVVNKTVLIIGESRQNTIIDGNGAGNVVYVTANSVTISGFTILNSGTYNYGIYLNSFNSSVYGNNAINNYYNIELDYCSNCSVYGNNASNNDFSGINLYRSSGISIYNNDASNNGGGISLYYSPNCSIYGNNLNNSDGGIALAYSCSNCSVYDNNASYNDYGIWLVESSNCSIYGNDANNNIAFGIALSSSSNNTIMGNNAKSNTQDGIILSYSDNNEVADNNIKSNRDGINVEYSSNNRIFGNNITNNNWRGVFIFLSSDNKFYHNNFIDNGIRHVEFYYSGYANVWDNGYPSGGNYWSDYTGMDLYRGPYQNETGSDGIGDTPYVIDEDNQDNYPLTKPYPWSPHDIGITSVTTSKSVVGQGFNFHIAILIFNYGNEIETFNVTAFADTEVIATFIEITLTSRSSTTVTFTWNTTGFAKGNHTISAVADTVPDETDTEDNTFVDGWVLVSIPGDVNGDRKVDGKDVALTIKHYGSYPGHPKYNPNVDINCDGKIDGKDVALTIKYYGKWW
jgi:parallel beta-helix repeat protein